MLEKNNLSSRKHGLIIYRQWKIETSRAWVRGVKESSWCPEPVEQNAELYKECVHCAQSPSECVRSLDHWVSVPT